MYRCNKRVIYMKKIILLSILILFANATLIFAGDTATCSITCPTLIGDVTKTAYAYASCGEDDHMQISGSVDIIEPNKEAKNKGLYNPGVNTDVINDCTYHGDHKTRIIDFSEYQQFIVDGIIYYDQQNNIIEFSAKNKFAPACPDTYIKIATGAFAGYCPTDDYWEASCSVYKNGEYIEGESQSLGQDCE